MGELNIAPVECLNILYEITHPQKIETPYEKGEHSYRQCVYDGEKVYLEIKYRHLPYAKIIIKYLSQLHMPHRRIDKCLEVLDLNLNHIFMESYVGVETANEIYKIIKYYKVLEEVK